MHRADKSCNISCAALSLVGFRRRRSTTTTKTGRQRAEAPSSAPSVSDGSAFSRKKIKVLHCDMIESID
jgi:hypothetical protein